MMRRTITTLAMAMLMAGMMQAVSHLRPSGYPLITIDPYMSGWSLTDRLYDSNVKHWTEKDRPLLGIITVDGVDYQFMGLDNPATQVVAPNGVAMPWPCRYVTEQPVGQWQQPDYDDSAWKQGKGAFATGYDSFQGTRWTSDHVWLRRTVLLDDITGKRVTLGYSHDDDAIIWINGVKVVDTGHAWRTHQRIELTGEALAALHPGENVIAATCWNRDGGGVIDVSLELQEASVQSQRLVAAQYEVDVQATQTHYRFACGPVLLDFSFVAPMLMDDLDLLSRPVNYLTYQVQSRDGVEHDVTVRVLASDAWATDVVGQPVVREVTQHDGLTMARVGTTTQNILGKKGDDVRIDWGYFYLAAASQQAKASVENDKLAMTHRMGRVRKAEGMMMVAYDDIYSVQYFGTNLRPYWNRDGRHTIEGQLQLALQQYPVLRKRCDQFDADLMAQATLVGGREYAELCALAYRQAISAHKLVESPSGEPLWLSKENFSNGSIGTVDITYPSSPMFLLYNPRLVEGMMNHIFDYSEHRGWTKPFPAHDVGTYPLANGQTYGEDMPVEEAGNMLILTAALAVVERNADYAARHWDVLTTWAEYLSQFGLDPANQLCTDDFAGHLAHNTNLSIKAILGIYGYGYLAQQLGKNDVASRYQQMAREMATEWKRMANDGDHYRLTFDRPGTWSQKYNLVWDRVLGWNIFDPLIAQTEVRYYLTKQNPYGLPLDSRENYMKIDWLVWAASLATERADFESLIHGLYRQVNETRSRVPLCDLVRTTNADKCGMQARSVVGAFWVPLLQNHLQK